MHGIWGMGQMMFTKIIVVVDKDVNVQNVDEVMWRVGNNVDPRRDVTFADGPMDALEHASDLPKIGSKMGIDATKNGLKKVSQGSGLTISRCHKRLLTW